MSTKQQGGAIPLSMVSEAESGWNLFTFLAAGCWFFAMRLWRRVESQITPRSLLLETVLIASRNRRRRGSRGGSSYRYRRRTPRATAAASGVPEPEHP
jgi:hypothetical protein